MGLAAVDPAVNLGHKEQEALQAGWPRGQSLSGQGLTLPQRTQSSPEAVQEVCPLMTRAQGFGEDRVSLVPEDLLGWKRSHWGFYRGACLSIPTTCIGRAAFLWTLTRWALLHGVVRGHRVYAALRLGRLISLQ